MQKGGLVISRHNKIRDELDDLTSKTLSTTSAVRTDEPEIDTCRYSEEEKSDDENKENSVKRRLRKNRSNEDRGDMLGRDLWARGAECVIDARMSMLSSPTGLKTRPT